LWDGEGPLNVLEFALEPRLRAGVCLAHPDLVGAAQRSSALDHLHELDAPPLHQKNRISAFS